MIVFVTGCEKKLQQSWWDKLWFSESYIMEDLNNKHKNTILPKIDDIRTTIKDYVVWDKDTIAIHGPGGYHPTADKAVQVWLDAYQKELMSDTTKLTDKGELANIIKKYLELRRKHDAERSFVKMRLAIPKEIYDQDEHFWEWFLRSICDYLTDQLGGHWNDGVRDLEKEKIIYKLPTADDPNDPWGCNCSAVTRLNSWYFDYAEGPSKMMKPENYKQVIDDMRQKNAQSLYEKFTKIPDPNFPIGNVEDYKTKKIFINGSEYYVLDLPVVQMHE